MANLEFEDYEEEVFADTRPVVALACLGHELILLEAVKVVENALRPTYTIIQFGTNGASSPSTQASSNWTNSSSSVGSGHTVDISIEWLRKYLSNQPAIVIAICAVAESSHGDTILTEEILKIRERVGLGKKLVVALWAPEGLGSDRRDGLTKATHLPSQSFVVLTTATIADSTTNNLLGVIDSRVYYKEQIRKYRKRSSAQTELDNLSALYSTLTLQFKIGFMELFLRDFVAALKSFNIAYGLVVEHCRRLDLPEERNNFLASVRWVCDVMAFKIVWMLVSRGDKEEADEYVAGHVSWFKQSHADQVGLCKWTAKIYDAMAKLVRAAEKGGLNSLDRSKSPDPLNDKRHAGYYCYLAAKHAIVLEQLCPVEMATKVIFVERVLELLVTAYDTYRKVGHQRMTMQIGRLIASQYLLVDNHEQAFQYGGHG